jgi:hypothetical protein
VAPLSGNLNLSGGQLWIEGASFDCEDVASDFDLLLARGVTIYSDCNYSRLQ